MGLTGPAGATGPAGVSGIEYVTNSVAVGGGGSTKSGTVTVSCSASKKVIGGGGKGDRTDVNIYETQPLAGNTGWQVSAASGNSFNLTVFAICATAN